MSVHLTFPYDIQPSSSCLQAARKKNVSYRNLPAKEQRQGDMSVLAVCFDFN